MMWRGKAVGMRLGKCVRGEELWQCGWTFKPDIPSGGLNIEFVMGYDDNILIFNATRIGQLVEKTDTHWELEYNWGDLWNLDWGEISETLELEWAIESESELDSESEAHVDSERDLSGEQPQVVQWFTRSELRRLRNPD